MRLRGKVLRTLDTDAGLVIIEGRQYPFSSAQWRSTTWPVPGMEVIAVLDQRYQITELVLGSEGSTGRESGVPRSILGRVLHWLPLSANRNRTGRRL